jgi:hypothetical protein
MVFQPNAGICLLVIFDNIIQCLKALWETCVTHVAPKRLRLWPLGAEAVPLSIVSPTATRVTLAVLGVCALVPLAGLVARQGFRVPAWMSWLKTGQNLGR